jgi:excisionase family DNA binding protein
MLQNVAKMLQDVLNMLQNVSNMLQDVAMSQNVPNMSHNVSNMSHNVTDNVSQNVSIVSHSVAEKLQSVTDYLTASQLAKIVGVARRTINDWILEGRIQSAKLQGKNLVPKEEALKLIFKRVYDELNAINHYGDSVPVPVFKDAVKKKLNISDDEIEKTLLDLDTEEVLYLQTLDRPSDFSDSDRGIKFEGRILYFITWMKK